MKTYTIIQNATGLTLLGEEGKEMPARTVLNVFPDRKVYAFWGPMGAGKTTFIKQLCEELGVTDVVNSPTFAIVNVYEDAQGEDIYHFDCYRLKSVAEAQDFGAEDYLYSGCYCFVEWPDIISPLLPKDVVTVQIEPQPDGKRILRVL